MKILVKFSLNFIYLSTNLMPKIMNVNHPRLKLKWATSDYIAEILSSLLLVFFWSTSLSSDGFTTDFYVSDLLEFNLLLPLAATVAFVVLSLLNHIPHRFHFPLPITSDNAEMHYKNATRFIRYLKGFSVLLLAAIGYGIEQYLGGKTLGFGSNFTAAFLLIVHLPLIYFVVQSRRDKRMRNSSL